MTEDNDKFIFIVGNPRSGTTMMSRMLGNHPSVHSFKELHFFEKLWSPRRGEGRLPFAEAARLAAALASIEKDGFFGRGDPARFIEEGKDVALEAGGDWASPIEVYRAFLRHRTSLHGKSIPCEQTPWYVYYLDEILALFPGARVINMVRDPRDVLLSQKKRWVTHSREKRRSMALRTWMNYHPISTSRLWRSAVRTAMGAKDGRIRTVRFEDVLKDPERELRGIAEFAGVRYREGMLDVPMVGSSIHPDRPGEKGVDRNRTAHWRSGLNSTEAYICQKIAGTEMEMFGYGPEEVRPNPLMLVYYLMTLGLKTPLSVLIHSRHIRDVGEAIRRRLV